MKSTPPLRDRRIVRDFALQMKEARERALRTLVVTYCRRRELIEALLRRSRHWPARYRRG